MARIEEVEYLPVSEDRRGDFGLFLISQKKLSYLLKNQKLRLFGVSLQPEDDLLRNGASFFVRRDVNNNEKEETVKRFINKIGFGEYFNLINRIAWLIYVTVKTTLYPIHIVGFSLSRRGIDQLKVYYMIYTFTLEEDIMGSLNKELNRETLVQILKELDLEEKIDALLKAMQMMESNNYQLEFIGLNIEKGKTPGLKLYFKP